MIVQFIRISDEARHHGCLVHSFTMGAGKHAAVSYVHRLWVVRNQGLISSRRLFINDQAVRCTERAFVFVLAL